MRLYTSIALIILCLSCSCNKETEVETVGKPEMNGIFAYVSKSDADCQDIFLQNRAGTENISSTWPISSPSCPRISADGKTLLFHGKENGRWRLYKYDITTGELPVCISGDILQDCQYPRFVYDGRIVFSKSGQIAILDTEQGKVETLTFDPTMINTCGTVLPDGKTCYYISGSGSSACVMMLDLSSGRSSSVSNTGGVTCLEVSKDDSIVYSIPGKGVFAGGKPIFTEGDVIHCTFGNWVIISVGDSVVIGNMNTAETYPLDFQPCESLFYADADVVIAEPKDGGYRRHGGDHIDSDTERPALTGKMLYHSYTSYETLDSKMYLYDFGTNDLQEISSNWTNVRAPMNGHFSEDGKTITFMGIGTATESWDIFIYELGSVKQPENLTPKGNYRDEDPKFSFDGKRICFKRNGQLSEIDVAEKTVRMLSSRSDVEFGMPYYSVSGDKIVFGGVSSSEAFIGCWNINTANMTKLYDSPGVVEYYPITIDEESFYYTGHVSASNPYDQLYIGYWDGRPSSYLPFNKTNADYSDACPISDGWLILCSTRQDSRGQYDLYIGNCKSGAIYSLSNYNNSINTSLNELGPSYWAKH